MQTMPLTVALYIAFDLGSTRWTIAFSDGRRAKPRVRTIQAGDVDTLFVEADGARRRLSVPSDAATISCFEAGRDGFWLHRLLEERGWKNHVIDAGSLEAPSKKRAKTDRIDADKLLDRLVRHVRGEHVWSVVAVPSAEIEDIRRVERERERLKKERSGLCSRFWSVLALYGVLKRSKKPPADVEKLCDVAGRPLPPRAANEVRRLRQRLDLLDAQIAELEADREEVTKCEPKVQKIYTMLASICGIGPLSAFVLASESFGWRTFANTRQVSASIGLAPTPHQSDRIRREKGISKAARPKLRSLMVQLAWLWLRYQPDTQLSRWYSERFASGGGRAKRIGIVALARKIYVALWKYVEHGELPAGLALKPA
jgi:transposase